MPFGLYSFSDSIESPPSWLLWLIVETRKSDSWACVILKKSDCIICPTDIVLIDSFFCRSS